MYDQRIQKEEKRKVHYLGVAVFVGTNRDSCMREVHSPIYLSALVSEKVLPTLALLKALICSVKIHHPSPESPHERHSRHYKLLDQVQLHSIRSQLLQYLRIAPPATQSS